MESGPSLVVTLLTALAVAYAGGLGARALRLPPIVGYLLAGVVVGPAMPGLVVDPRVVDDLAQFGVVLLLFGVGLHFRRQHLLQLLNRDAFDGKVCFIGIIWLIVIPGVGAGSQTRQADLHLQAMIFGRMNRTV